MMSIYKGDPGFFVAELIHLLFVKSNYSRPLSFLFFRLWDKFFVNIHF